MEKSKYSQTRPTHGVYQIESQMILHQLADGEHLGFKDGVRNDLVCVLRGALKYRVKL